MSPESERHFLSDEVLPAIASGRTVMAVPVIFSSTERDGERFIEIAALPNFWLCVADGLYHAGRGDAGEPATYRIVSELLATQLGMTRRL